MDRSEFFGASSSSSCSSDIRLCTPDDVEWMISICERLWNNIDKKDAKNTLLSFINNPDCCVIRSDFAAGGVGIYGWEFNRSHLIGEELFVGSISKNPMEALKIYRFLCNWSKDRKAAMFKFSMSADSRSGKSLNPIAKRLGAVAINSNYVVRF